MCLLLDPWLPRPQQVLASWSVFSRPSSHWSGGESDSSPDSHIQLPRKLRGVYGVSSIQFGGLQICRQQGQQQGQHPRVPTTDVDVTSSHLNSSLGKAFMLQLLLDPSLSSPTCPTTPSAASGHLALLPTHASWGPLPALHLSWGTAASPPRARVPPEGRMFSGSTGIKGAQTSTGCSPSGQSGMVALDPHAQDDLNVQVRAGGEVQAHRPRARPVQRGACPGARSVTRGSGRRCVGTPDPAQDEAGGEGLPRAGLGCELGGLSLTAFPATALKGEAEGPPHFQAVVSPSHGVGVPESSAPRWDTGATAAVRSLAAADGDNFGLTYTSECLAAGPTLPAPPLRVSPAPRALGPITRPAPSSSPPASRCWCTHSSGSASVCTLGTRLTDVLRYVHPCVLAAECTRFCGVMYRLRDSQALRGRTRGPCSPGAASPPGGGGWGATVVVKQRLENRAKPVRSNAPAWRALAVGTRLIPGGSRGLPEEPEAEREACGTDTGPKELPAAKAGLIRASRNERRCVLNPRTTRMPVCPQKEGNHGPHTPCWTLGGQVPFPGTPAKSGRRQTRPHSETFHKAAARSLGCQGHERQARTESCRPKIPAAALLRTEARPDSGSCSSAGAGRRRGGRRAPQILPRFSTETRPRMREKRPNSANGDGQTLFSVTQAGTEGQTLCDLTCVQNLRQAHSEKQRVQATGAAVGGQRCTDAGGRAQLGACSSHAGLHTYTWLRGQNCHTTTTANFHQAQRQPLNDDCRLQLNALSSGREESVLERRETCLLLLKTQHLNHRGCSRRGCFLVEGAGQATGPLVMRITEGGEEFGETQRNTNAVITVGEAPEDGTGRPVVEKGLVRGAERPKAQKGGETVGFRREGGHQGRVRRTGLGGAHTQREGPACCPSLSAKATCACGSVPPSL
ncbi:hypothetical protein Cadr_000022525 [Camelus dromedarius]|uniref:Uncharacterized protein n=1 Tax=Camelus dromedarius TaxID=9838 RepID=A0A5N4CS78_CAMDR|nr:hypothetical protein Cadr_000022525 [Camelus dromedarius]